METSIFTLAGKEQVSNGVSHGAATTGTREGLGRGNHDKGRLIEVQPRAAEGHPGSPLCRSTLVESAKIFQGQTLAGLLVYLPSVQVH